MSLCPAQCTDVTLTPMPAGSCEPKRRKRGLKRLIMFPCSLDLPSPLTCDNLLALVESNQVVISNDLVNSEFADPEIESYQISDCSPSIDEVVGRVLTVEDHIAVDLVEGISGSQAFGDLRFWGNKKKNALVLRYGFVWCDGTLEIPREYAEPRESGAPLAATLNVFRVPVRTTTGNQNNIYEIKRATINFKGDPLALTEDYAPDLDLNESGCEDLAQLFGF
jgi:hypothetical protein